MTTPLWNSILAFDLDNPPSEYGFTTRLAAENYWTKNFTQEAILEYKKFMFLAAISDKMVSPSEIIDTVWHQHLLFSQSYQQFCAVLGKQVHHLPSTHNKEDAEKFKQAKDRTQALYATHFGDAPDTIWKYGSPFESLGLPKARIKIRSFLIIGILASLALIVPFYFIFLPINKQIPSSTYIFLYILLSVCCFTALEIYNRWRLQKILEGMRPDSFIKNLQALELVFLNTQKLELVITGYVNELILRDVIGILDTKHVYLKKGGATNRIEELQITSILQQYNELNYRGLVTLLVNKPVFTNIPSCMEAIQKYVNKSNAFSRLFYFNFVAFVSIFLLGTSRLMAGIVREKPILIISALLVLFLIAIIIYLIRLSTLFSTNTLPSFYVKKYAHSKEKSEDWQWRYFLQGKKALVPEFIPLVLILERTNTTRSDYSVDNSSCGSSCGSSCSSCGGCGGD